MLCAWQYSIADQVKPQMPDSLRGKSCIYLSKAFKIAVKDTAVSLVYARAWLAAAIQQKDFQQMSEAYKALMHNSEKEQRLYFADKMVDAAQKTGNNTVIGSAYLSKGALYYNMENHVKALDNYILADEYISKTEDQYLIHKVKYSIALTKMYLGFYDESLGILKECVAFYSHDNERAYLASLHALGICYNRLGQIELSSDINKIGMKSAVELEDAKMLNYYKHSEGINYYFRKDYNAAITQLSEALYGLDEKNDIVAATAANFYIAKSYWELGRLEFALKFLEKVNLAFVKYHYTRPELREAFEMLINYYKGKNNEKQQLFYINRLLEVDNVLIPNYKYLSGRIQKEYDTRALIRSKHHLEAVVNKMSNEKIRDIFIIAGLSAAVIITIFLYVRTRRKYKRNFEEWRRHSQEPLQDIKLSETEKDSELDINPELEATILKNLEKFEAQRKYKEKDMSLVKMAAMLQANPKYVSKVIQRSRGKKFTDYMNEIRIGYIIEMLEKESRWRNYTNQALAHEAGFGSTQNFTRAFNNKMGMPPTFFIQELKKELTVENLQ